MNLQKINVCQILNQNEIDIDNDNDALTLTLKGFPFAHWCGSQKQKTLSFAQVALAIRLKKFTAWQVYSTWNFISKANIALIHTRTISVFHVKFNMEFSRQAVHFSINSIFVYSEINIK